MLLGHSSTLLGRTIVCVSTVGWVIVLLGSMPEYHPQTLMRRFFPLDGLEMATTVFGGEVELSQPSSLISEESAIAQIEKELQEVVSGSRHSDEKENKKKLHLASFNTPPLHFDPSNSSESTDNDDLSDGAPQSSPCYVPTATEQRSVGILPV